MQMEDTAHLVNEEIDLTGWVLSYSAQKALEGVMDHSTKVDCATALATSSGPI